MAGTNSSRNKNALKSRGIAVREIRLLKSREFVGPNIATDEDDDNDDCDHDDDCDCDHDAMAMQTMTTTTLDC